MTENVSLPSGGSYLPHAVKTHSFPAEMIPSANIVALDSQSMAYPKELTLASNYINQIKAKRFVGRGFVGLVVDNGLNAPLQDAPPGSLLRPDVNLNILNFQDGPSPDSLKEAA